MLARILVRTGGDLGRQQVHDGSIFVGRPNSAVLPQKTRPGTLLAAETARAVKQPRNEPLESYGNLGQSAAQLFHHFVNHAAAYQRLADCGMLRPQGAMREQISDGYCEIMIWVHQPSGRRDDSMPVGVRIVGECDAVFVLESDKPGHRVRAGTVHANHAVMIHGHERKRRVNDRVNDCDIHIVDSVDRFPIGSRCASKRIDAKPEAGALNRIHVNDISQVADVWHDKVFLMGAPSLDGCRVWRPLYASVVSSQEFVGPVLNPARYVGVGGTAITRIVFKAAILWRVVRRRDHDAVREVLLAAAVINQDGARDNWSWRDAVVSLNYCIHVVGRQNLKCGALGRFGYCVRVLAHVKRPVSSVAPPVIADSLRDGQNVCFGKAASQRRASVSTCSEADHLVGIAHVRPTLKIFALELGYVDQHLFWGRSPS